MNYTLSCRLEEREVAGLVSGCWRTASTEITAAWVSTFDPVRLHFLFENDVSVGNVLVHFCMNTRLDVQEVHQ